LKRPLRRTKDEQCYDNTAGLLPDHGNVEELYAKVQNPRNKKKDHSATNHIADGSSQIEECSPPLPPQDFGPKWLFIFRHAERVDVTFGKQWIQLASYPLTQVAAITGEISTCQRRFQNTKEDQVIS
jgi:hypothetical protein